MNLNAKGIMDQPVVENTEYELSPKKSSRYLKGIIFRESNNKSVIARTCVALIGSALIAFPQLPIKKKERPTLEIKPAQINSSTQNRYRHEKFPVICLSDLAEQFRQNQ